MSRLKKISRYSTWIAILVIFAGVIYDIKFAGIPYQDAPDYLIIKYERNQRIANGIIWLGVLIGAAGITIKIIGRIKGEK